jgi:hypothetical protein
VYPYAPAVVYAGTGAEILCTLMTQGDTPPSGSTSQRRVRAPPRAILLLLVLLGVRCTARADTLPCESKSGLASLLQAGKKPNAGATATQATTKHDSKRSISARCCKESSKWANCLLCDLCGTSLFYSADCCETASDAETLNQ